MSQSNTRFKYPLQTHILTVIVLSETERKAIFWKVYDCYNLILGKLNDQGSGTKVTLKLTLKAIKIWRAF